MRTRINANCIKCLRCKEEYSPNSLSSPAEYPYCDSCNIRASREIYIPIKVQDNYLVKPCKRNGIKTKAKEAALSSKKIVYLVNNVGRKQYLERL